MARCARCGRENQDTAAACLQCGALLPRRAPSPRVITQPPRSAGSATPGAHSALPCPSCGILVPTGFKFCGGCGAPLASRPGTPRPLSTTPMPPVNTRRGTVRANVSLLGRDGAVASTVPITQEETVLGGQGDVPLADPHAAPVQARLLMRGTRLFLRPERTPNGTFLLLRQEQPLSPGVELRVGRQLLRLEERAPHTPVPASWGSPNPGYVLQLVQLLAGGEEGDVFPLRDGDNLVGRAAGDVSFPGDGYVSSRHAVISLRGRQAMLRDLGSSNGTFLRLMEETELVPGDLLLIGEQLVRVEAP